MLSGHDDRYSYLLFTCHAGPSGLDCVGLCPDYCMSEWSGVAQKGQESFFQGG
jgi:hypothetical protein